MTQSTVRTPEKPPVEGWAAVYRLFDSKGDLLYIGSTGDPSARWSGHKFSKPWWPRVADWSLEWHPSREAAYAAERQAIRTESPKINVHWVERKAVPLEQPQEVQEVIDSLDAIDAIQDRAVRIRAISQAMAAQIAKNKLWSAQRREFALELKEAGKSVRAIAAEVGTSPSTVQSILSGYSGSGVHRPRKAPAPPADGPSSD